MITTPLGFPVVPLVYLTGGGRVITTPLGFPVVPLVYLTGEI